MRHPTDGVLRRLLDEPAGVADADREHVAGCPQCLAGLAAAREDAALAGAALRRRRSRRRRRRRLAAPVARDRRRRAPDGRAAAGPRRSLADGAAPPGRRRRSASSPSWPAPAPRPPRTGCRSSGPSRSRRSAITPADLRRAARPLARTATLEVTGEADVHEVADAAAAEEATGLDVPEVSDAAPRRHRRARATRWAARSSARVHLLGRAGGADGRGRAGEALPPPPPGLDGSRFRLDAGPGLAAVWSEAPRRARPGRRLAPSRRRRSPPASRSRRRATTCCRCRACPTTSRRSCARFSADGTTLPLPVPADEVTTSPAEVDGAPATVLASRDGDAGRRGLGGRRRGHRGGRLAERRRGPVGRPRACGERRDRRPRRRRARGARCSPSLPPSPAVWCSGPAQAVRPADGGRRRVLHGRPRRGRRAARAERRRQDHGDQDAARPGPPRRRRGAAARAAGAGPARRGPASATCRSSSATSRGSPRPRCWPCTSGSPGVDVSGRRSSASAWPLVGLADRAGDRVGGFSKGMQQRLGLAVALVARPGAGRPRRADQRAGPARPRRRARPVLVAEGARRRRAAQLAPDRRGRAGLRPGRHPRPGPGRRRPARSPSCSASASCGCG